METKSLTDLKRTAQNPLGAAKGVIPQAQLDNITPAPVDTSTPTPPIKVSTPFGSRDLTNAGASDAPVVIGTIADMLNMISTESGIQVTTLDEVVSKVINPFKSLRGEVEKLPEMESKLNTLSEVITTMPDDLKQMVHSWMTGGNYQEVMSNQMVAKSIDFTKDFGDHNEIKLINHFTKGNFSQETFATLDPTVQESLKVAARTQYDMNKRAHQAKPDLTKVVDDRRAAFVDSVERSILTLKAQFPDMDATRVQEIRNTLLTGGQNKRIYANDGTYKPTAAADVAMIFYGPEAIASQNATINQIMEMQLNKGASQAVEELLNRTDRPNTATQRGTATPNQEIAKKVKESTAFLRSGGSGEQF